MYILLLYQNCIIYFEPTLPYFVPLFAVILGTQDEQATEVVAQPKSPIVSKPKKKKGSLKKAPEPVMGRDTKVIELSAIQAGTYAFLTEYVRSMTHAIGPQDPPVQPFFYPGRGPLDACRVLHSMYECRALILHATHLTLIAFVVTIPAVPPTWHWLIKLPVART